MYVRQGKHTAVQLLRAGQPAQQCFGFPETLFARIHQLLPAIVEQALRKQLPVIRRHASRAGQG